MKNNKGFIVPLLLGVIALLAVGGYFVFVKQSTVKTISNPSDVELNEKAQDNANQIKQQDEKARQKASVIFSQNCNFLEYTKWLNFNKKLVSFKYPNCWMTQDDPNQISQVEWYFVRNDSRNLDEGKRMNPYMKFSDSSYAPYSSSKTTQSLELTIGKFKALKRTQSLDLEACKKVYTSVWEKACQDKRLTITLDVFKDDVKLYQGIADNTIFGLAVTFDRSDSLDYEVVMDKIISTINIK